MDRCAVFVDAGYLYAEGGKLCCGTPSRTRSVLQPALASNCSCRWRGKPRSCRCCGPTGDAARDGIRTQEQREVAALANVKLLLGRLNSNNQLRPLETCWARWYQYGTILAWR